MLVQWCAKLTIAVLVQLDIKQDNQCTGCQGPEARRPDWVLGSPKTFWRNELKVCRPEGQGSPGAVGRRRLVRSDSSCRGCAGRRVNSLGESAVPRTLRAIAERLCSGFQGEADLVPGISSRERLNSGK